GDVRRRRLALTPTDPEFGRENTSALELQIGQSALRSRRETQSSAARLSGKGFPSVSEAPATTTPGWTSVGSVTKTPPARPTSSDPNLRASPTKGRPVVSAASEDVAFSPMRTPAIRNDDQTGDSYCTDASSART